MKLKTKGLVGLKAALKEIEPFIRDPKQLLSGKPLRNFGEMRPRELLGNWLISAVLSAIHGREFRILADPTGADGLIHDPRANEADQTEHVYIPKMAVREGVSPGELVLEAIRAKSAKGGEQYARGKTLVVFLDAPGGPWFPDAVAKSIGDHPFPSIWVVGLQRVDPATGDYIYGVVSLCEGVPTPKFHIGITADFEAWEVTPI